MSFLSAVKKSELKSAKKHIENSSADLADEFKSFLDDMEDLFHSTTSATGEDLVKAKAQFKQRVKAAKANLGGTGENILQQARKTAEVTNDYVYRQPWTVIGAGVALSFLLGFVLARRD